MKWKLLYHNKVYPSMHIVAEFRGLRLQVLRGLGFRQDLGFRVRG